MLVAAAACDSRDGTRLQEPAAATTLPPVDTTPLPSVPIEAGELPAEAIDGSLTTQIIEQAVDADVAAAPMQLFAPWVDGGPIDARYSCDGLNASPAMSWSGLPVGTVEVAIALVDDSDVSTGRPFIHWVMGGIDVSYDRLAENEIPIGAIQGINFFGDIAYAGPCPNPGETHDYRLTVFALSQQLELPDGTPSGEILDFVGTVALTTATVSGVYMR